MRGFVIISNLFVITMKSDRNMQFYIVLYRATATYYMLRLCPKNNIKKYKTRVFSFVSFFLYLPLPFSQEFLVNNIQRK